MLDALFSAIILQTQFTASKEQVESGFGYVIAAFLVIWLVVLVYMFWLHRRQQSLHNEVIALRQDEAERIQHARSAETSSAGSSWEAGNVAAKSELGG